MVIRQIYVHATFLAAVVLVQIRDRIGNSVEQTFRKFDWLRSVSTRWRSLDYYSGYRDDVMKILSSIYWKQHSCYLPIELFYITTTHRDDSFIILGFVNVSMRIYAHIHAFFTLTVSVLLTALLCRARTLHDNILPTLETQSWLDSNRRCLLPLVWYSCQHYCQRVVFSLLQQGETFALKKTTEVLE